MRLYDIAYQIIDKITATVKESVWLDNAIIYASMPQQEIEDLTHIWALLGLNRLTISKAQIAVSEHTLSLVRVRKLLGAPFTCHVLHSEGIVALLMAPLKAISCWKRIHSRSRATINGIPISGDSFER